MTSSPFHMRRALLQKLQRGGRLAPLIQEVLADQVIREHARAAGLAVTSDELQEAADSFRRRHGLLTAADTQAWMTGRGLSLDDFEAGLEEDLLALKVRQHVAAEQVEPYWAANQSGYERLRLALVMVGREELAREVAIQVREDGRDLTVSPVNTASKCTGANASARSWTVRSPRRCWSPRPSDNWSVRLPPPAILPWRWSRTVAPPS